MSDNFHGPLVCFEIRSIQLATALTSRARLSREQRLDFTRGGTDPVEFFQLEVPM